MLIEYEISYKPIFVRHSSLKNWPEEVVRGTFKQGKSGRKSVKIFDIHNAVFHW